jgi:hypothetical protein
MAAAACLLLRVLSVLLLLLLLALQQLRLLLLCCRLGALRVEGVQAAAPQQLVLLQELLARAHEARS